MSTATVEAETEAPVSDAESKPCKVRLLGPSLLFAWERSDKVEAPNGAATDAIGSLREQMRTVHGVAVNTLKKAVDKSNWASRQFTVTFSVGVFANAEILMLWNLFGSGTKRGAEHDAAFAGRNALRPLYDSIAKSPANNGG